MDHRPKGKLAWILLGLCLGTSHGSFAQKEIPFSGVAFTTELTVAKESMPYTYALIGDSGSPTSSTFRKNLSSRADGQHLKDGASLSSSAQNRLKYGQSLAIALAIERERMQEIKLNEKEYRLSFDIDATILAFNFRDSAIVSSHPIRVTLLTSLPIEPGEEDRVRLAKIMFFGDPDKEFFEGIPTSYLINEFINVIQDTEIREVWGLQIRVKNIDIAPQAETVLSDHGKDPEYLRQLVASSISSSMSTRLRIPVLPYIKSQAIQSSMTLKFLETDLMNFEIPEASFHVDLTIRGFGSKTLKKTSRTKAVSYITGVKVDVIDIDSVKSPALSQKFQAGNVKRVTLDMTENLWHEYEESLLSLLDQIVVQIGAPNKKWVQEKAAGSSKSRDVIKAFKAVNEQVIKKVRMGN